MLEAATFMPLPVSLSNLISLIFPSHTQRFYDSFVEPIFPASGVSYRGYLEAIPAALVPFAMLVADVTLVFVSFGTYMITGAHMLAVATVMAAVGAATIKAHNA